MIYIAENILDFDIEEAMRSVSEERRAKALRYRFDIDRRQSIAAYLLLMYGLKQEYGIEIIPEFIYTAEGKPFICDHPNIHFNLSHCRNGVACAISNHPIGVDIEEISPLDWDVALRVMNGTELNDITTATNPEQQFCTLWTTKESLLKQTGEGLCDDLQSLAINEHSFTHYFGKNYVCTACYSTAEQHEDFKIITL